jgi:predicted amidohydrolase
MKVTLLQTDICWGDAPANIKQAEALIDASEGSDLYVLPEMWSTGFATQPEELAHDVNHNEALQWMRSVTIKRKCAISGSLAVRLEDGSYRNRHYFVDGRAGKTYHYDKHHLFSYGHEDQYFTPGNDHLIVDYEGWRLLILTCYDLRFPCWSRYATGREYDAIILVANWPDSRQEAWQVLTQARAIENQCYLVGVNRVGDDAKCHYIGGSVVVDVTGHVVARCGSSVEALTYTLDKEELLFRRSKFCVLEDRD